MGGGGGWVRRYHCYCCMWMWVSVHLRMCSWQCACHVERWLPAGRGMTRGMVLCALVGASCNLAPPLHRGRPCGGCTCCASLNLQQLMSADNPAPASLSPLPLLLLVHLAPSLPQWLRHLQRHQCHPGPQRAALHQPGPATVPHVSQGGGGRRAREAASGEEGGGQRERKGGGAFLQQERAEGPVASWL